MSNTARFVTLTTAVVTTPATASTAALTHLAGLAMLVAERDERPRWTFTVHANVAEAGDGEARLLQWTADRLPPRATLIGWQLADRVLPPLLDAAAHAPPVIALHFTSRFARLASGVSIDVAIEHGGAGAPLFSTVAAAGGIAVAELGEESLFTSWAFGTLDGVSAALADEAVALWRFWVASAGGAAAGAATATAQWLAGKG